MICETHSINIGLEAVVLIAAIMTYCVAISVMVLGWLQIMHSTWYNASKYQTSPAATLITPHLSYIFASKSTSVSVRRFAYETSFRHPTTLNGNGVTFPHFQHYLQFFRTREQFSVKLVGTAFPFVCTSSVIIHFNMEGSTERRTN